MMVLCLFVTGPANADNCTSNSVDSLKRLLQKYSPFVGSLKKGNDNVLVKFSFEEINQNYFAVANIGNVSQDELGDREMEIRFQSSNKILLRGKSLGLSDLRKVKLILNADCRLVAKRMMLQPGSLIPSTKNIASKQQLARLLAKKKRYQGKWHWSGLSGDVSVRFAMMNNDLKADFNITTSGGVSYTDPAVPVRILSASLMFMPVRLSTHNAYTGPVRLWLNHDHSLGGVSYSAPEPYKLKLKLYAQQ